MDAGLEWYENLMYLFIEISLLALVCSTAMPKQSTRLFTNIYDDLKLQNLLIVE